MIQTRTKKLAMMAMLCALAFMVMAAVQIPLMTVPLGPGLTLRYEPKDVIILIGGFMYGPLAAFIMSLAVSLVEMVTVSETGPIGMVMNVLSSASFTCTAALIYKYKRTRFGAFFGLLAGCILTAVVMTFWNYLIVPLYTGVARENIAPFLLTFFFPFNLIKGGINVGITMLIYKPVSKILKSMTGVPNLDTERKDKID